MIYSHGQNVVVYRKFTAEGFWHESQDYEFTHNYSRKKKTERECFLPFGRSAREEEQRSGVVSVPLMGFLLLFWLTALCLQGHNESRLRLAEGKIK